MRSCARALAAILAVTLLAPVLQAQTSQAERLYAEALKLDAALRKDIEAHKPGTAAAPLLERARVLVTSFKDLSRLFPSTANADNALWQGATLSAVAFWQFGDVIDRDTALELFDDLSTRFPASPLVKQSAAESKRLAAAAAPPPALTSRTAATAGPPRRAAAASLPPPTTKPAEITRPPAAPATPAPSGPAVLKAIRRDVLPDVLRITLELEREVSFYDERLDAPARVFIDLRDTSAAPALRGATIPFPDDLVRQLRVGLHLGSRTRVVLDLTAHAKYSVYSLYNPFRVVIDFERGAPPAPPREAVLPRALPSPPVVAAAGAAAKAPATPAVAAAGPAAPPAPAAANTGGGFSLSRQLGLGIARIVIDPGHGGQDPGARGRDVSESSLVLDVALRLEKLLLKQPGVEVVLTRRANTYVPLEERTAIANRVGADLFLSIHANASSNAAARGIETYFLNFATTPEAEAIAVRENAGSTQTMGRLPDIVRAITLNNKIDESRDFASIVQTILFDRLRKVNRNARNLGVKQAPFMVLIGATMPSILTEISFLTNKQDLDLLKTEKYRQQIADALFAGVMRYQESLKKVGVVAGR
jgi:N-acetylmuramoyl-L-alanine amidase